MTRTHLQFIVALMIAVLWAVALILTFVDDGSAMLRALSAPMGLMIGWLFTSKATEKT